MVDIVNTGLVVSIPFAKYGNVQFHAVVSSIMEVVSETMTYIRWPITLDA